MNNIFKTFKMNKNTVFKILHHLFLYIYILHPFVNKKEYFI